MSEETTAPRAPRGWSIEGRSRFGRPLRGLPVQPCYYCGGDAPGGECPDCGTSPLGDADGWD
jgi:hypothetical protein